MKRKETVGVRRLKNQASRILDEVHERGADYVVTKRGRPVAVIRPWRSEDAREERELRARELRARLSQLAERVAAAADTLGRREGAASAVSGQRR